MAIVAVDSPSLKHTLDKSLVAGSAHVVDNFIPPAVLDRLRDPRRDHLDRFLPIDPLPFSLAALTDALHRMQDSIRIIDLVDRRWPLRAQPATTRWVQRVALELANLVRFLINVRELPACRFAVEAGRRNQPIVPLRALRRPLMRISPESGRSKPPIRRKVEVLPEPEGPSNVRNSPFATVSETSSTAVTRP